jgi:hypothetical protein
MPNWARWTIPIVAFLLLVSVLGSNDDSGNRNSDPEPAAAATTDPRADEVREEAAAEARAEKRAKAQKAAAAKRAKLRRERARLARLRRERAREQRRLERERAAAAAAQAEREQAEREAALAAEEDASSGCDANYSPCVPSFPPDVNCPDVSGPVTVTGTDVHGLDADNDGTGCDT